MPKSACCQHSTWPRGHVTKDWRLAPTCEQQKLYHVPGKCLAPEKVFFEPTPSSTQMSRRSCVRCSDPKYLPLQACVITPPRIVNLPSTATPRVLSQPVRGLGIEPRGIVLFVCSFLELSCTSFPRVPAYSQSVIVLCFLRPSCCPRIQE